MTFGPHSGENDCSYADWGTSENKNRRFTAVNFQQIILPFLDFIHSDFYDNH